MLFCVILKTDQEKTKIQDTIVNMKIKMTKKLSKTDKTTKN